jgi:hypothetical protein
MEDWRRLRQSSSAASRWKCRPRSTKERGEDTLESGRHSTRSDGDVFGCIWGGTLRDGVDSTIPAQQGEVQGPVVWAWCISPMSGLLRTRSGLLPNMQLKDMTTPVKIVRYQWPKEGPIRSAGFQKGDWAWLYLPTRMRGKSPKLQPAWEGPYSVATSISDVVYRIQLRLRAKMSMVHLDRLAPYLGATRNDLTRLARGYLPP